jgi:AraC-like DNA-binding protein
MAAGELEETDTRAATLAWPRARRHNRFMVATAVRRAVPSASTASAVAALVVDERDRDLRRVVIPRSEVELVVRFGPSARGGLDVHALGGRQRVLRKVLRNGQRVAMARLHLGATEAVLGVPAAAIAGSVVAIEDLWGAAATRHLLDRLASARGTTEAAAILEAAIAERFARARRGHCGRTKLVLEAADRLRTENVSSVAADLEVSARHLRRIFHETIGVSPKTYAKVTRFRRAVRAASEEPGASWATIATVAGYYDQAHLIAEFRAIAGVTPRAFLGELRSAQAIG